MSNELICEVCHKNKALGVAASALGPISHAYCGECLAAGADVYETCVACAAGCGSYDDLAPWAQAIVDASLKVAGKTREEFDKDVDAANQSYYDFMEKEGLMGPATPADFSDFTITDPGTGATLEWEWIGEGDDGDYQADDPEDTPRLRANLKVPWDDEVYSYCTMASPLQPRVELEEFATDLFANLRQGFSPKRPMEEWTWRTEEQA